MAERLTLPVRGMHCAACVGKVEQALTGAIVQVTSGGAVIPQPFAPLYSACKAALHSYTLTLRHALAGTGCQVIELMPPAVATGLAGSGHDHGAPVDDFCAAALTGIDRALAGGPEVIGYGMTADERVTGRVHAEQQIFDELSGRCPITTYATGRAPS